MPIPYIDFWMYVRVLQLVCGWEGGVWKHIHMSEQMFPSHVIMKPSSFHDVIQAKSVEPNVSSSCAVPKLIFLAHTS